MKIEIRLATEKDKEDWNRVVLQSRNGTFYNTWEWVQTVSKGLSDTGEEVITICAEQSGKIVGIYPMFLRPAYVDTKFKKYLPLRNAWSPHPKLYTFGGPCATGIEAEKINEAMVKHSLNLMRKRRNVLIYWIWGFDDTEFKKAIERLGFSARRKRKTTFINLEPDEDSIFDSFKKKYRQNIRTGEKEGVTIIESNTQEDLAHFYDFFQKRLEEDIRKQPGMGFTQIANATIPRAYFSSLWENAFQNNMVRMFFAEHNGKRIGALINFYYKDMAFLGHTSILREHGDLQAYKILIWHTIKDAKKNGFKRLDLTGLPPSEAHGQYRFKKDWNGEVIETTEYKRRVK